MKKMFNNIFENKKVLITGDTGFKGSWLAIWLKELGADVYGYALPPLRDEDNFVKCNLNEKIHHINGDIRDKEHLVKFFNDVKPDIAFHLAAQAIVLESYKNPHYTFETNVMGTVNFFEAVRNTPSVKAAVNITSDKCYKNNDWVWGYRENDPVGGKDPYSASKGCSELITDSYLNSFFKDTDCKISSARAGNVIGAGDWAENRIIPDYFRALLGKNKLIVRNPIATRPWQHVLEPLSGYLLLASKLSEDAKYSGGWNFGPKDEMNYSVRELLKEINKFDRSVEITESNDSIKPYEAKILKLDISKAVFKLGWKPVLDFNKTVELTVSGYLNDIKNISDPLENRIATIKEYLDIAAKQKIKWSEK
ncbi:MAG: CDP-glucose 4,6-dehydratase [Melioribacteraceae bacterium]